MVLYNYVHHPGNKSIQRILYPPREADLMPSPDDGLNSYNSPQEWLDLDRSFNYGRACMHGYVAMDW
jgi:hypothetical protein